MYKQTILFVIVLSTFLHTKAQFTLERVLVRHYEAIGQASLESIRSLKMDVTEVDGFGKGSTYEVVKKRPLKIRKEGEATNENFIIGSNGKIFWRQTGTEFPQTLDSAAANLLMVEAMIGSPLKLSERPGFSLFLMEPKYIDRRSHHVVRLYFPDLRFMDFFIDKRDWLIKKLATYADYDESKVNIQIFYDNYRRLGPYLFSYKQQRQVDVDKPVVDIIVGEIAIGVGADNSIFNFPE